MNQNEQKANARRIAIANTEDANEVIQDAMKVGNNEDHYAGKKDRVLPAHGRALVNFS